MLVTSDIRQIKEGETKSSIAAVTSEGFIMEYRKLGRTNLTISEIGFGCGSAGGLSTRDRHDDQLQAC